jgi:hypothetical protein
VPNSAKPLHASHSLLSIASSRLARPRPALPAKLLLALPCHKEPCHARWLGYDLPGRGLLIQVKPGTVQHRLLCIAVPCGAQPILAGHCDDRISSALPAAWLGFVLLHSAALRFARSDWQRRARQDPDTLRNARSVLRHACHAWPGRLMPRHAAMPSALRLLSTATPFRALLGIAKPARRCNAGESMDVISRASLARIGYARTRITVLGFACCAWVWRATLSHAMPGSAMFALPCLLCLASKGNAVPSIASLRLPSQAGLGCAVPCHAVPAGHAVQCSAELCRA